MGVVLALLVAGEVATMVAHDRDDRKGSNGGTWLEKDWKKVREEGGGDWTESEWSGKERKTRCRSVGEERHTGGKHPYSVTKI